MAFATIGTRGIQAGSVDLDASVTGTLPVANGGTGLASGTANQFLKFTGTTTLSSAVAPGKIGQIVTSNITGSGINTSNTSYTSTGDVISITPTATSSKVLILFTGIELDNKVNGTIVNATVYNGGSNLASSDNFLYQYDNGRLAYSGVIHHIHSPNSTSAQTYTLYVKCNSNSVSFLEDAADCTFTLMEILA